MDKIRVALVDDHELFRAGLSELLNDREIIVIGMTGKAEEAFDLVVNTNPDIVLLDLSMGNISGMEVLQQIAESIPDQRVVVLTGSMEELDVLRVLQLGANGYLTKDIGPDDLVKQLRAAHTGEVVVSPHFTGMLALAAVAIDDPLSKEHHNYLLTPREMDILSHIANGESNKHIANKLGIVPGTVKLHVRQILKKLGVKSRLQAAILAVSENLCDSKPD